MGSEKGPVEYKGAFRSQCRTRALKWRAPFRRVHGSPMGGTTGVSLEQGLGLTDISRGRPGRRPGGERSSPPDYYFIIDKINPGPHRGRLVGPLVPSS